MHEDDGFMLIHRDELQRDGKWLLVRRSLGVSSFGINMVELQPGESIPEHDETDRDQEEVFAVLDGTVILVVDGVEHEAPAGTLARFDPQRTRTAVNRSAGAATLLMVSAPRTSGYEPLAWA